MRIRQIGSNSILNNIWFCLYPIPVAEFYQSSDPDLLRSRSVFWDAVRSVILEQKEMGRRQKQLSGQDRTISPKRRTENASGGRRRRF